MSPFVVDIDVSEATQSDRAIRQLLPIVVAISPVHSPGNFYIMCGSSGKHLKSRGADFFAEFGNHSFKFTVDSDNYASAGYYTATICHNF